MLSAAATRPVERADLPEARGPLSAHVLTLLRRSGAEAGPAPTGATDTGTMANGTLDAGTIESADPYGEDLQLALYCCYELHYQGFAGVDDEREWDLEILGVRRLLERRFLAALRSDVTPGADLATEVEDLLVESPDAEGVSHHLRRDGELWQLREYIAHRSIYHLKEADPQAWVIPRLSGPAKTVLVGLEYDEYGAGRPDWMHARLFGDMMLELGLSDRYGAYLDVAPAPTLAEVNFMSLCGLHRALRGALVGQFAVVELTSSPGSERLVRAMRRLGCGPAAIRFYDEHVEADAVHEQMIRLGVLGPLLAAEPELERDVVFGIRASLMLGDRLGEFLLSRWADGLTTLRGPLA